NFAAFAAFFLINNTRNGFVFASQTLVPVMLATAIRDSRRAIAILLPLVLLNVGVGVADIHRRGAHGANDPLLSEVRFFETTLGPRDVLLVPGRLYAEVLYLSHFNIIEVSAEASRPAADVPLVHPGPMLRARIAWWLDHGGRVYYALGDDTTDFTGDVGGAQKARQIFWRSELTARERAPALQALRTAVEAYGLEIGRAVVSPRGERYAEVRLREIPSSAAI